MQVVLLPPLFLIALPDPRHSDSAILPGPF